MGCFSLCVCAACRVPDSCGVMRALRRVQQWPFSRRRLMLRMFAQASKRVYRTRCLFCVCVPANSSEAVGGSLVLDFQWAWFEIPGGFAGIVR